MPTAVQNTSTSGWRNCSISKLFIESTKFRSRHVDENVQVKSKNGAIVRKDLGYFRNPQKRALLINSFYRDHLNPNVLIITAPASSR